MGNKEIPDFSGLVASFRTSNHWAVSLARDLLWVAAVVGGIALILWLICGTWPALVAIESGSMDPHMKIGDLVVVGEKDRYGTFRTWLDGSVSNYTRYDGYGDVIIYRPNGRTNVTPIIHRATTGDDFFPAGRRRGREHRLRRPRTTAGLGDIQPAR